MGPTVLSFGVLLAKSNYLIIEYHIFKDKSCHIYYHKTHIYKGLLMYLSRPIQAFVLFWVVAAPMVIYSFERPPERVRKDISVSYKEERLNGTVFGYRQECDHVTSVCKPIWLVDNKPVSKEEYEKKYRKAEKQQRIKERHYQEHIERERHERVQYIAAMGSLRLLELAVADIESTLKKLDDKSLQPFLRFANNSISSQDILNQLQDEWLPKARKLLRSSSVTDAAAVNELLVSLEPMPDRLSTFFYDSVENGIKNADDPKLLKKWLAVVA